MTFLQSFMAYNTKTGFGATLSYGVLQELRDTCVVVDGIEQRLLDEVDLITAVSGGSFTVAYYALYSDLVFLDFETRPGRAAL